MNLQAQQMAAQNLQVQQMAAQVANQGGGASVPVMNGSNSNSNSNIVSAQIQASVDRNLDPDYVSARLFMTHKIYEFLMQRQQQSNDRIARRVLDVVKPLEEGLFRTAATKEEYMNLETLENRLRVLIRRLPMNNPSNSSTSTMIPTPEMPQSGNSSLMRSSSVESSMVASGGSNGIASSVVNAGNFFPSPSSVSGGMHIGLESSSSTGTVPLSVYVELRREHHELLGAKNQLERLMDTYTSMSPALNRDSTARLRALIETATTEMKEFPPATDVKHGHGRLVCQMMINEIQSIVNQEQKGHDD